MWSSCVRGGFRNAANAESGASAALADSVAAKSQPELSVKVEGVLSEMTVTAAAAATSTVAAATSTAAAATSTATVAIPAPAITPIMLVSPLLINERHKKRPKSTNQDFA